MNDNTHEYLLYPVVIQRQQTKNFKLDFLPSLHFFFQGLFLHPLLPMVPKKYSNHCPTIFLIPLNWYHQSLMTPDTVNKCYKEMVFYLLLYFSFSQFPFIKILNMHIWGRHYAAVNLITCWIRKKVLRAPNFPCQISAINCLEVITNSGILDSHSKLIRMLVNIIQQQVHVGVLNRCIKELFVTALKLQKQNGQMTLGHAI